ncbi:LacI family DNA-binding transcriptional regulator [Paenibacillus hexagrammi]|uniref:LacI family transcriptional regulator n=1 Tax=Paenibacillus hexagrammi TaxID=2908839 RepID=A0ABY3SHA0_9BACL|nr:LacI family DNA-binding transcriptional regulator [Paenibacillus sp. YPD9-1]UJF32586.1 LacI family transcriptional regulator [Paenibacillus sp. YPD9-1]
MKKTETNSEEIARLAGVSRSTVSRVINNYSNVPEKTRAKVMKVIEQYNYVPNLSAQVLAGKKTKTIGLFFIDAGHVSGDMLSNLMIASIIEYASSFGYYVLTHIIRDSKDPKQVSRIKETYLQRRVDGGIFIGAANYEPFIEELVTEGYMVAIVDQNLPGRNEPNRIVVNFDNEHSINAAVDYLVSLNHSKIGIVNGDMKRYGGPSKYEAFVNAMSRNKLEIVRDWVLAGDFNETSGYQAVKSLLGSCGRDQLPTALIAANDSVAFGVIRALQEEGISVPDDISVIGFDDHAFSARFQPSLTTFRMDFECMMLKLTELLINNIEQGAKDFNKVMIQSQLIVRESCKKL